MAEQTMKIPSIPSALRRAKEAAENESQDNAQVVKAQPEQTEQGRGEASQPAMYQFSGFEEKKKSSRVTRTFTMEPETETKLEQAARKYGVSKSAILERAFLDWYELVNGQEK